MLWQWSVQDISEEDAKHFHNGQSLRKCSHFFPKLIWLLTLKIMGLNLIQLYMFLLHKSLSLSEISLFAALP